MKRIIFLLSVFTLVFYSCSPSVEGESKSWKRNTENLNKLAKQYPVFAKKINEQIASAEKIYKEAEKISKEEEKAEKMRSANDVLHKGCVGKLQNTESIISDLKSKIKELQEVRTGMPETDVKYANIVIKEAETSISNLKMVLAKTEQEFTGDPCVEFESAYSKLEIRLDDLETSIKNLRSTKKDLNISKKEGDKKGSDSKVISSSEKKKVKVECEYCGAINYAEATECKSCSAPLKN